MTTVPYTMADVADAKGSNGLTMAGSFSGAGGSSLGWTLAGFDIKYACEFDPHAARSYKAAFPTTEVDGRSIANVTGAEIKKMAGGDVDVWEGSPPCSKFSIYGQREKGWGRVSRSDQSTQSVRNVEDLVFEWIRVLGELKPRAAVAENVPGMIAGGAKGYAMADMTAIRDHGYNVKIWKLNASAYGVPQIRRRIFFVCWDPARCAEPRTPATLTPAPMTASEAIRDLPTVTVIGTDASITDLHHAPDVSRFAVGKYAMSLKPGQVHPKRFSVGIAHPDRPSPTLTSLACGVQTMTAGPLHWSRPPRKFSIAEQGRLSSFPDDYPWPPGTTWGQAGLRLGNIVPPLLAKAVAGQIAEALNR